MILQYCVPGYLVLKFFQFLSSRKIHEHTIVASCVISFLLLCVCEMIGEEVPAENWANTVYGQVLLAVLIGAFFAMISGHANLLKGRLRLLSEMDDYMLSTWDDMPLTEVDFIIEEEGSQHG